MKLLHIKKIRIILFTFSILFLMALSGCKKISLKEKAISAYEEILKSSPAIEGENEDIYDASFDYDENKKLFGDHIDLYAIYDINKDDIPELIALSTINFRWAPISIYAYVDNKPFLLKDPLNLHAHGTFEEKATANGVYSIYFCDKNHIHNLWHGITPIGDVEENHAYSFDGKILKEVECNERNENVIYFSEIAKLNEN